MRNIVQAAGGIGTTLQMRITMYMRCCIQKPHCAAFMIQFVRHQITIER